MFMGSEFGQPEEWNADAEIGWRLEADPTHRGISSWLRDVLSMYKEYTSLWTDDPSTFAWVSYEDRSHSVVTYRRFDTESDLLFVFNLTPVSRKDYSVGVPGKGKWTCILNSDDEQYAGTGNYHVKSVKSEKEPADGHDRSIKIDLPPLGLLVFKAS